MIKIPVYNLEGEKKEDLELDENVFGISFNSDLVHQITVSLQNNMRVYTAHTKNRGEVRGGGKKPWKQKGTGRARAGSNRSPIWRGGGITFGPRNERNYTRKINKKMGNLALKMVLGAKLKDEELRCVEELKIASTKTKEISKRLNEIKWNDKSVLILTSQKEDTIKKAVRNLPKVNLLIADNLNALDLLTHKFILIDKEAVKKLQERLLK